MFASIILISAVFVIVANKSSIAVEQFEDFTTYRENYIHEAQIVLNNAIYDNKNLSAELISFTEEFISYTETKNQDVGIVYLYSFDNNIYVGNYLNEPIIINPGQNLLIEQEKKINFKKTISIKYRNETFSYKFSDPDEIVLKSLFVKE